MFTYINKNMWALIAPLKHIGQAETQTRKRYYKNHSVHIYIYIYIYIYMCVCVLLFIEQTIEFMK